MYAVRLSKISVSFVCIRGIAATDLRRGNNCYIRSVTRFVLFIAVKRFRKFDGVFMKLPMQSGFLRHGAENTRQ